MGWFKKKKKILYTPTGRIGYKRISQSPYEFTIIVEQLLVVGDKCKFMVLEVSVDRDCNKSVENCLKFWGVGDWTSLINITWETTEQWSNRLGLPEQETFIVENVEEGDIKYRLTPHSFVNNQR